MIPCDVPQPFQRTKLVVRQERKVQMKGKAFSFVKKRKVQPWKGKRSVLPMRIAWLPQLLLYSRRLALQGIFHVRGCSRTQGLDYPKQGHPHRSHSLWLCTLLFPSLAFRAPKKKRKRKRTSGPPAFDKTKKQNPALRPLHLLRYVWVSLINIGAVSLSNFCF